MMTRLKLHPSEFMGLVDFLCGIHGRINLIMPIEPMSRSIYDQILVEYWQKAKLIEKVPTWRIRNSRQRFTLHMPVSVMRILHQEMQHVELTIYGQAFLATLDKYLTNELSADVYAKRY